MYSNRLKWLRSFCRDGDSKWLEAFYDPMANLYTFTQCMTFGDIHADGDMKLVLAHLGTGSQDMKLKVFKGESSLALLNSQLKFLSKSVL